MLSLFLVVPLLLLFLYWKWRNSAYGKAAQIICKYPGPPTNPIFGNVLQLSKDPAELLKQVVFTWYPRYGSPMKLVFGPFHSVHIFRANHIEAMLKSHVNIKKSRDYRMAADWLGEGLLISDGAKWHERRKLLTPAFHFGILKEDFYPIFNEHGLRLVDHIRQKFRQQPTKPIDMTPLFTLCTLDVICETAMGKKINALENESSDYVRAILRFSELMLDRAITPWLWPPFIYYTFTRQGWEMKRHIEILHSFTRGVIKEREEERGQMKGGVGGRKRRLAFLDLLLELKEKGALTTEGVREEVDTFMFEGHDTTACGLMWACYLLGRHPEIQERVREELDAIIDDIPSYEQLMEAKYLECCIKEAQRVYPPVPVVVRYLDEPLKIDENYTLPKASVVNINFVGLHHDPERFPEPLKFDPERFNAENSQNRHPFAFTPFSAGLRNCIGQKFAMLEQKTILCHLLRNFKLESLQDPEDMNPAILLVYRPSNGVWIRFTEL